MMKQIGLLLLLISMLLVACTSDDADQAPAPTPTPTSIPINFSGPMLGGDSLSGTGFNTADEAACTAEGGCVTIYEQVVTDVQPALPLTSQQIMDLQIGVPQGYSIPASETDIFMSAVDVRDEGGFTVLVYEADAADLAKAEAKLDESGFEGGMQIENPDFEIWLAQPYEDRAIARLTVPDGRQWIVDASTNTGYWLGYEATLLEILQTIRLDTPDQD